MKPQHFERPQTGWQLLAPGVYVDEKTGEVHLFDGEFLEANGYADTEENRAMLHQVLPELIRLDFGPDIPAWLTTKGEEPKRL